MSRKALQLVTALENAERRVGFFAACSWVHDLDMDERIEMLANVLMEMDLAPAKLQEAQAMSLVARKELCAQLGIPFHDEDMEIPEV